MRRAAIALLVAAAACTTSDPAATTASAPAPATEPEVVADPFQPPDFPRPGTPIDAVVTNVLDGDSMEVTIGGNPDEVRFLGINAPEGDECGGDAARQAMIEAVADREVVLYGSERDQFGRLLALVEVDGDPVGWRAVRQGLAVALSVDHPRLAEYAEAEDDAFIDQIGMWAEGACGEPTDAVIGIADVVWDPPGRDSDNLNEEIVVIGNFSDPVDVEGWVLRDESTRWRYVFPAGFILTGEVTVHTGCGDDDRNDLYWCANDPLWSNFGDTVILLDDLGSVVARVTYGAKTDR